MFILLSTLIYVCICQIDFDKIDHGILSAITVLDSFSEKNQAQAAKSLGLDRSSLRRILARNSEK